MFKVRITNAKGKPIKEVEQVTMKLESKEMNMGESTVQLHDHSSGQFKAKYFISMAGKWNIQIHVLTKSLEEINATFPIFVGIK